MIRGANQSVKPQDWNAIGAYLETVHSLLISDATRSDLRTEWEQISDLEDRLEDALLLGFVGGTGVGKSTLINALAGSEVSRSGDRRPTTDRVVVYMHRDDEIPAEMPTSDFGTPLVIHRQESLCRVIILDFPDFDSAELSHAEILQRYLPHLDVLLILVDEMKYGDRRLYEVLRSLGHDPRNLFLVLNKIDRFRQRYGDRATAVANDILQDLRGKVAEHTNFDIPADHTFAISAGRAYRAASSSTPSNGDQGQFAELRDLIESYQQEKRRRLAKEHNIDVRKASVSEQLAAFALSESNQRMLEHLQQIAESSASQLHDVLQTTPRNLFGERDRRHWRQARLREAARHWGLPISLALTLFAEIGRLRGAASAAGDEPWKPRVDRHYRSYFEAARNVRRRFEAELQALSVETGAASAPPADAEAWRAAVADAASVVTQSPASRITHRWLAHVLPIATLVAWLSSRLLPTHGDESGHGWLWSALGTLHPWFLLNVAISVVMAYFITAGVLWLRESQRLDEDIARAEEKLRAAAQQRGEHVVRQVRDQLEAIQAEFEQVRAMM